MALVNTKLCTVIAPLWVVHRHVKNFVNNVVLVK